MAKEKVAKQPKPVKQKPPKAKRGRMPTKRSINLMIVNENKINFLVAIPAIVLMQTFAYHVAVARGNDVDKPRNLAKSVTVE